MTTKISSYVIQASLLSQIANIVPRITSIGYVSNLTATDTAGGQAVTVQGSGFQNGATVYVDTTAAGSVTVSNSSFLSFTAPAKTSGSYVLYVTNPDGGSAIYVPGVQYSGTPTWNTPAGSQGNVYETVSYVNSFTASGDPLSYSLLSGSFPPGAVFNTTTGILTGTAPVESGSTTYSFTIRALDIQNQYTDRSFSLTINTDVVTWVGPTAGNTYASDQYFPISSIPLQANSAAGYALTYTANALPVGISLVGSTLSGTPTTVANSSTLLTATAATTNRSATRVINWVIRLYGDAYLPYVSLGLGANTAATSSANSFVNDTSINNSQITVVGDTRAQNNNPYQEGYYSFYSPATGSYLTGTTSFNPASQTRAFTFECWVYPTTSTIAFFGMGNGGAYGNGFSCGWASNNFNFGQSNGGAGVVSLASTSGTYYPGQWYHYAVTNDTLGVRRLFVNGILVATQTYTAGGLSSTTTFIVNGLNDNRGFGVDGGSQYISNLRLIPDQTLYTSNFVPGTTPLINVSGTNLLLCKSNRFIDNSPNSYTLTVAGTPQVSPFNPFGNTAPTTVTVTDPANYSVYFDGTGDYVTIPMNPTLELGAGNFTIEFWLYSNTTAQAALLSHRASSVTSGPFVIFKDSSNVIRAYVATGTASYDILNGIAIGTVANGAWYHIAITRNSATFTGFFNGLAVALGSSAAAIGAAAVRWSIGADLDPTNYLNGFISNLRIVKGQALYLTSFTPSTTPLTVFPAFSTLGYSTYFDGSGDYLSIPTSSAFGFGTGDFTVEAWFYGTVDNATDFMIDFRGGVAVAPAIFVYTSNQLALYYNGSVVYQPASLTFTFNTWNHVALVRSAGVSKFYLNGTGAATTYTDTNNYPAAPCVIGSDVLAGGTSYWTGYISSLRIVKGQALYTTNFTPSTAPLTTTSQGAGAANVSLLTSQTAGFVDSSQYAQVIRNVGDATPTVFNPFYSNSAVYTALLTCQNNTVIDNGALNTPFTVNGDARPQQNGPFLSNVAQTLTGIEGSAYFDGSGDYLSVTASPFSPGTGDFTWETWIYTTAAFGGTTYFLIVDISSTGLYIGYDVAGTFGIGQRATALNNSVAYTLPTNRWTHIAVARQGSTVRFFTNGAQIFSGSNSINYSGGSGTAYIGGGPGFTAVPACYMSNYRFVKGTAVYTSAFFPGYAPLTNIANTSLLTLQTRGAHNNSAFIDNSSTNTVVTRAGNVTNGTFSPYGTNWSYYFNGSTDYLTLASNAAFQFGSGDFTVEFWINQTSLTGYQTILSMGYTPVTAGGWAVQTGNGNGNMIWYYFAPPATTAIATETGATVSTGTWYHIAVVRSGTTTKIYRNGVLAASGSDSNSYTASVTLGIGAGSATGFNNYYVNGYISNLRIVKGQALYTANFTPATSSLTTTSQGATLANVSLLTAQDNRFRDGSVNNFTVTTAGTPSVQKFSPFVILPAPTYYYSGSFNGSTDYLTVANNVGFTFPGDFTVECWVYSGSNALVNSAYPTIFATSAYNGTGIGLKIQSSGGIGTTGVACVWNNGSQVLTGTTVISNSTWYHIAVSRSGTSMRLCVNGFVEQTITNSTIFTVAANYPLIGADATSAGNLSGYISNLRVIKGQALYTGNFSVPAAPLAITQTASANVAAISGIPVNGNSVYFNGSTDYLTTPNLASLHTAAASNWTVEAWIYTTSLSAAQQLAFFSGGGSNSWTAAHNMDIGIQATTGYLYTEYANATASPPVIIGTTALAINRWYHLAWVYNGTAKTVSTYINGVVDTNASSMSTYAPSTVTPRITIGRTDPVVSTPTYFFAGYISNFRLVVGQALYTGAFTTSTAPIAATQTAGTNIAALPGNPYPVLGNSIGFNGSTDYLSVAVNAATNILAGGDFTMECWFYIIALPATGTSPALFASTTVSNGFVLRVDNGTRLGWIIPGVAGYPWGPATINTNTWYHVAVCRVGTVVTGYVNGVQYTFASTNRTVDSGKALEIGNDSSQSVCFLNGYISNARVIKGTALYTANFTVPTAPLSMVTGTGVLTCQNSTTTTIDNSVNNLTITQVGTPFVSRSQSPFGTSATLLTCQPTRANVVMDNSPNNISVTVNGGAKSGSSWSPFGYSPSLLTLQDNYFVDNSLDKNAITAGSTTVKPARISPFPVVSVSSPTVYTPTVFGGSMYFDGTGDYLSLPSLGLFSTDFTIEGWIYLAASTNHLIFTSYNLGSVQVGAMIFSVNTSNQLGASNNTTGVTPTVAMSLRTWNHVVMTYKLSTTTITTYVNGVRDGSVSAAITASSTTNWFGASPGDNNLAGYVFNGYMADMRITKGTVVYSSNFYPGTSPVTPGGTVPGTFNSYNSTLLVNGATGGIIDATRTVDLETVGDARAVQNSPYSGNYYSNLFGSGNYIYAASNAAFAPGTGDFTVEAWVFPTAAYTTYNYVLGVAVTGGLVFYVTGGNLVVRAYNVADQLSSATIPSINTWTHVAASRSGTTLRIFVNGTQTATSTNSYNFVQGAAYIGNDSTNAAPWYGYISNFRFVKGQALYTTTFTPSTTPLTTTSQGISTGTVSLLTCQSNKFVDNSANAFAITTTGTPQVATQNPFQLNTGTAYYFDGTGDQLISPNNALFDFGSGNFTVECWVYASASTGSVINYSNGQTSNANFAWEMYLASATTIQFSILNGATQYTSSSASFSLNVWHHVAGVRNGNTLTTYLNGVAGGTTATVTGVTISSPASSTLKLSGWNNATGMFTGYIADLRITKGYARYTGTFTPPTTPLLYR